MNWPFGRFGDEVNVRLVGAEFTVSNMVPVIPPKAAEIVVEPAATPVARPEAVMVAALVAEDVQVTEPVRFCVLESE
jgi:hypothetical protein